MRWEARPRREDCESRGPLPEDGRLRPPVTSVDASHFVTEDAARQAAAARTISAKKIEK